MSVVAALAVMTVSTLAAAGPASAAAGHYRAAATAAAPGPAVRHARGTGTRPSVTHRASRARTVTLATLVRGVAVRTRPSPSAQLTTRLRQRGTRVAVRCYTLGTRVAGNPVWYQLSSPVRGYVTSYYLSSHHDPARGLVRCAAAAFRRIYHTLVAGVHIRYWPTTLATRLTTLGRMGSKVTVNCYVLGQKVSGDSVWYHSTRPVAGFLAGANLNTGRDPAYKIPACW